MWGAEGEGAGHTAAMSTETLRLCNCPIAQLQTSGPCPLSRLKMLTEMIYEIRHTRGDQFGRFLHLLVHERNFPKSDAYLHDAITPRPSVCRCRPRLPVETEPGEERCLKCGLPRRALPPAFPHAGSHYPAHSPERG